MQLQIKLADAAPFAMAIDGTVAVYWQPAMHDIPSYSEGMSLTGCDKRIDKAPMSGPGVCMTIDDWMIFRL